MVVLLYGIIILCAATLGAAVGIGGGVIIKPLLDALGFHTVEVVSFISSCAVFSMSISASLRHIRAKTAVKPKIVLLISLGAVVGGNIGNHLFDAAFDRFQPAAVKGIQASILALLVLFILFYVNARHVKSFHMQNPIFIALGGLLLGLLSAFLGIGGGPINTTFLVLLFSFTVKESAVYSVAIIFFSQLSRLVTVFVSNHFAPYLPYYPLILTAMAVGILGGVLGVYLNKKLSDKAITKVFSATLVFVLALNIYNAVIGFAT